MKIIAYTLGKIMLSMLILTVVISPAFAQQAGASQPSINITSPKDNTNLPAGNVIITVDVKNFNLVAKYGQASVPGEGHIHYYIDVPIPKTPDKPATTAVGTFVNTANTSYTWQNVKAGRHNFSVQLANNDHTPLIPLVYKEINVTVSGTLPGNATSASINPTAAPAGAVSMNAAAGTQTGNMATINLVAKNLAFNMNTITVPAGSKVTINFDNQDSGIPHNFAAYTDSSASQAIYKGSVITGPKTMTYTFTAPTKPGTYFFRCDVHPTQMTGQFIVK